MNTEDTTAALPCAQLPPPPPECAWLQKFVGEWDNEVEITMEPGQEPLQFRGTESARMVGGFWLVSRGHSEMMGSPFESILTLGFDSLGSQYVGTWIGSMSGYLWKYQGSVNKVGDILSLDTEGTCPKEPGKIRQFREVYTFLDADTRLFTTSVLGDDGAWTICVSVKSRRKA